MSADVCAKRLHHAGHIGQYRAGVRTFLASDVQSVESIGAVGTQLEAIVLSLGKFLAGLILVKAVAAASDTGRLYGENQVVVVLSIEIRCQAIKSREATVDQIVFLIMSHRVTERNRNDSPSTFLELVDDGISEVDRVYGIVGAEGSGIIVEYHCLAFMMGIVSAELGHQRRNLPFVLDIERFEDIQTPQTLVRLASDNPVFIG